MTASVASADPAGLITEFSPEVVTGPSAIAAGSDGNLWFTDADAIGRITPGGQVTEFPAGLAPNSFLGKIALGPNGNMWFTDPGAFRTTSASTSTPEIGQITPAGQVTEYPTGSTGLPDSLAAGPDRDMWFTDGGTISRISPGGQITAVPTGVTGAVSDITAGAAGDMWFIVTTSAQASSIGFISPSGQVTEFPIDVSVLGTLTPDLAAGPDGNMWFTVQQSYGGPGVGRISPSGQVTTWLTGDGPVDSPVGIAVGPDGNVWFADNGFHLPNENGAIGRAGTGASPAAVQAPSVTGSGEEGNAQDCQGAQWAAWDSPAPSTSLYGFDGYRWQLDGAAISGQTASSYTPVAADVGHQLSCSVTVTYPLLDVTQTQTSAAVTVAAPPAPPPADVDLVICTRPRWGTRSHSRGERCATRLITGVSTASAATARATLSRYATTYATGTMTTAADGTRQLVLRARRWVGSGRYRLTLVSRRRTETSMVAIS